MQTAKCTKCKTDKEFSEFNWNHKYDKPDYWCKACAAEAKKKYYKIAVDANKQKVAKPKAKKYEIDEKELFEAQLHDAMLNKGW